MDSLRGECRGEASCDINRAHICHPEDRLIGLPFLSPGAGEWFLLGVMRNNAGCKDLVSSPAVCATDT